MFVNLAFLQNPFFPASCSVSFKHSISSDHATLFIDLPLATPPPPPLTLSGWIIEDQMEQEWKHDFAKFPQPMITDVPSLIRASADLITLIHVTSDKFFTRKRPHGNKGVAWWNKACSIAAADISRAHGPEQRHLSTILRATIRHTKKDWLEGLITDPSTSIWDLTKWHNSHHSPWIPPINGSLDPEDMGKSFKECFFPFPKPLEPMLNLPGPAALKHLF